MELRSPDLYAIFSVMIKRFTVLATALFLLAGCSSYGPEELDRLTKEDPNFRQMIIARDQINVQIRAIKADLLSRKRVMDAQIDKLRADYDVYAKAQNLKVEKYQAAIETNRLVLKREVETSSAQVGAKVTELEGYQKTLSDVQKVIRESKGIKLSTQERQKWEERVLMLSEKIRPLSDEIEDLKLQIRLKKQKISYLT